MSAQLYIALMASFRIGATPMFLDPSAGKDHIERCCTISPPKALIASSKVHLLRFISPALRQISLKFTIGFPVPGGVLWNRWQLVEPDPEIYPCTPQTPALITFTSGSTGQPKAAQRTHGFLIAQHRSLEKSLKLTAGDVDLTTLPIFLLANLASGVTSLIPHADLRFPGSIDAASVIAQIQVYQPQSTVASPAFLQRLVDFCHQQNLTLPSFKKIFSGGAPVFPRLLNELQQLAPQAEVTAVYGSTEAEPIAHINRGDITSADLEAMQNGRGLLVGKPVSDIQLRILRNQWGQAIPEYKNTEFEKDCLRNSGEAGEIVVSGEHVLSGYLQGRGDEETKFSVDGQRWHRTGDVGYLDSLGRLWLLGRCQACIKDAEGDLYPFTVECAADYHPGVKRAAVVSLNGKRLLVVEMLEKNSTEEESFLASLKQSLSWAHIEEIKVYPKIPVDQRHNAKINYPALQKLLARE